MVNLQFYNGDRRDTIDFMRLVSSKCARLLVSFIETYETCKCCPLLQKTLLHKYIDLIVEVFEENSETFSTFLEERGGGSLKG